MKKGLKINTFAQYGKLQQTDAKPRNYLAKVGVEGSNPFARSNYNSDLASKNACEAQSGKQRVSSARDFV